MCIPASSTFDLLPLPPHPPWLQRFLFMKLMYHDHAPEEYEPPFFVGLEDGGGAGHFSRKPFTMCVQVRVPACLPACHMKSWLCGGTHCLHKP